MISTPSRGVLAGLAAAALAILALDCAAAQQTTQAPEPAGTPVAGQAAYTPLPFDETSMDRLGNDFFRNRGTIPASGLQAQRPSPGLRHTLPVDRRPVHTVQPAHSDLRDRFDEEKPDHR